MKKLFVFLLFMAASTFAHSQAVTTNIRFNKADRPALMLELPYEPAIAEEFIIDTLKKSGYDLTTSGSFIFKKNKVDGFYQFKGVKLKGSNQAVDLYIRIEPKSQRQPNISIVYLLMDKGGESFVNSGDGAVHTAGKTFMDKLVPQSAIFKLQLDIETQEDALKVAEKKLDKLKEEEKKLQERLRLLQEDIKFNKEDMEAQTRQVDNEKRKLTELKAKKA
jgi:hypothetical protein